MPRRRLLVVAVLGIAALAAFVFAAPLQRAALAALLDGLTGYRVAFDSVHVGNTDITLGGVQVARGADPLLDARSVKIDYRLDEVFNGPRRYGLYGVTIERPHVTVVRYADGTFNFIAPAAEGAPGTPGAPPPPGPPLRATIRVTGGSVDIVDPNRRVDVARRLSIGDLDVAADVNSAASTTYHASGDAGGDRTQAFVADGRIDASGYALHRVRAADVGIVPWVNYFVNSTSARILAGRARNLDVRFYSFGDDYHVAGSAFADGAAMRVPAVVPSATGMTGTIRFFDNGLATQAMTARLGTLDVRLAGALYDWSDPKFELGIVGAHAPLEQLRGLFHFSSHLPIAGDARVATLLEGRVPQPVIATRIDAAAAAYAKYPLQRLGGRAIFYDQTVEIADAGGTYGGLAVGAGGAIAIGDVARSELVATVDGPAARVPYAAQVAPRSTLHAIALIAGDDLKLDARGVATGDGDARLSAVFHVDPQGEGTFGPLRAERADGTSVAGTYYLDRASNQGAFWLDSRGYRFASLAPHAPRLPGVDLAPPDFSGRLDGSIAAYGHPSDFRLAGHVRAHDFTSAKVTIADMSGDVTGHLGDLRVGNVRASGPWGSFAGRGGYAGERLALDGTYRGSFEALRPYTGDLGARGPVAGPVAMLIGAKSIVVQARGDDSRGATVRKVPVDNFSGTLAYDGNDLHVYSADAAVAGGRFAAAGSLGTAKANATTGEIGVSVAGAAAARLHAVAPLQGGGTVATIGRFGYDGPLTRYTGGLAVNGAFFGSLPVSAGGDVVLEGSNVQFAGTSARAGAAVATLDGGVSSLGTLAPRYDVAVALAPSSLGTLARSFGADPRYLNGTLAGDVRVSGTPATLVLRGHVALPEGSVNGQSFSAAGADVDVGRDRIGARDGTITVGSTQVAFDGFFHGSDGGFRIDAERANLADFNDLFDTGDTLGGRGHVRGSFVRPANARVRTQADLNIAKLQYKTFGLGDARLHWNSSGSSVVGDVSFGGESGRLDAAGTMNLPARAPVDRILERSSFSGNAKLAGLDLGVWLPALGLQLPLTGRVDAEATVSGPLRNPDVKTTVQLLGGTIGKFPVDKFAIAATSTLSRTTLQKLELDLPSVSVTGSGNFGLRAADKLALRLHARSPDVGLLAARALGSALPVGGTLEADLTVDGTRASPRVVGGFDLEDANVRGVKIPRALGQLTVRGRDLVLSDAEVGFATGTVYLAGSLPLELQPFAFGPANAPIELDFSAKGVDVSDFAPLFPSGSQLSGAIAGHVAVAGTVAAPALDGTLALVKGSLVTPFETYPLTDVGAELDFKGTDIALHKVHAASGGGTIDANGEAMLADLVHPGQHATYSFETRANHLKLSLPAYVSGTIDGDVKLAHVPGAPASLGGSLTLDDATIPFAALLLASGEDEFGAVPGPAATIPVDNDVALGLDLIADRNVRVRSANVDIGGTGTLHVGGLRSAPRLSGGFESTGGTLAYFNTVFRVSDGRVTFEPDLGVIPLLDAHAETHVINPDPNTLRNIAGTADITLDIHGPVTGLTIGLSSDPAYDRQQILGLLLNAPALGATTLFGDAPGQATLYGSNLPPNYLRDPRNNIATTTVAQEAFGVANAQFTRTLLAPIETSFAQAVGLTAFNVNVDLTGNVGFQARKILGKEVNAIYGTTFGYPYRQTVGFELKPNPSTAAQVTVFQTFGATPGLTSLNPAEFATLTSTNPRLGAAQPSNGTIGFSVSLQHFFK